MQPGKEFSKEAGKMTNGLTYVIILQLSWLNRRDFLSQAFLELIEMFRDLWGCASRMNESIKCKCDCTITLETDGFRF